MALPCALGFWLKSGVAFGSLPLTTHPQPPPQGRGLCVALPLARLLWLGFAIPCHSEPQAKNPHLNKWIFRFLRKLKMTKACRCRVALIMYKATRLLPYLVILSEAKYPQNQSMDSSPAAQNDKAQTNALRATCHTERSIHKSKRGFLRSK